MFSQIVDLPETSESHVAIIEGEILQLTDRWALRNENLLADNGQGYFGGVQYALDLHKLLEKTKWPPEDFEFYLTGSLGKVYSERDFVARSGVGGLVGGGLNYLPNHTERFEIQVFELRAARLPGLHSGFVAVVSSGIQVGF